MVRADWQVFLSNRALSLRDFDDYQGAMELDRRALELDPACEQCHFNLGTLLLKLGACGRICSRNASANAL